MTSRLSPLIAMAVLAMAMTPPLFSQADKPLDPKELAAVQKIRTRSKSGEDNGGSRRCLHRTNPKHVHHMVRCSARSSWDPVERPPPPRKARGDISRIQMDASGGRPTSDVGRVSEVHVADTGKGTRPPDALVDALSRPTRVIEMSFGRGTGLSRLSMTSMCKQVRGGWSAKTGE